MRAKKKQLGRKAVPVLGAAGLLMLAGGAVAKAPADAPLTNPSNYTLLGEEEISDVSLATFHVFDKESGRSLKLARGGCGGGGGCGCHGCGGCHGGGGGCGCHGGGCHMGGMGGGCHMGGCHMGGCRCRGCVIGGCGGCGGGGCGGGWCWSQGGCNPAC